MKTNKQTNKVWGSKAQGIPTVPEEHSQNPLGFPSVQKRAWGLALAPLQTTPPHRSREWG